MDADPWGSGFFRDQVPSDSKLEKNMYFILCLGWVREGQGIISPAKRPWLIRTKKTHLFHQNIINIHNTSITLHWRHFILFAWGQKSKHFGYNVEVIKRGWTKDFTKEVSFLILDKPNPRNDITMMIWSFIQSLHFNESLVMYMTSSPLLVGFFFDIYSFKTNISEFYSIIFPAIIHVHSWANKNIICNGSCFCRKLRFVQEISLSDIHPFD